MAHKRDSSKGRNTGSMGEGSKRKKKEKSPTQKTPQQRVMVMTGSGKTHMEWRDWR